MRQPLIGSTNHGRHRPPHPCAAGGVCKCTSRTRYGRYVDFLDFRIAWQPEHFGNQDHLIETGVAIFAPRAMAACFPE